MDTPTTSAGDVSSDNPATRKTKVSLIENRSSNTIGRDIGVMAVGGAGVAIVADLIDRLDYAEFPMCRFWVGDTNLALLESRFGDPNHKKQTRWRKESRLTIHQMGGSEVTDGWGAGAKPEVGRRAAESKETRESASIFHGSIKQKVLVGSSGGGTGAGGLPVMAQLAKSIGKTVMCTLVMPGMKEGRTERAREVLRQLEEIVAVHPIQNSQLIPWMKENLPKTTNSKMILEEGWQVINQEVIVRDLIMILEVMAKVGSAQDVDGSDLQTVFSNGKRVFSGSYHVKDPSRIHLLGADEVTAQLLKGDFQDAADATRDVPKKVILWKHGSWPLQLQDAVEGKLQEKISGNNPTVSANGQPNEGNGAVQARPLVEFHNGTLSKVGDGKAWVHLMVVEQRPVVPAEEQTTDQPQDQAKLPRNGKRPNGDGIVRPERAPLPVHRVPAATIPVGILARNNSGGETNTSPVALVVDAAVVVENGGNVSEVIPNPSAKKPISYPVNRVNQRVYVAPELADEFLAHYDDEHYSKEKMESLFDKIEHETHRRPDMPARYGVLGRLKVLIGGSGKEQKQQVESSIPASQGGGG